MKRGKSLQIPTLLVTSLMKPKFQSAAWSTKQDMQLDCIILTLLSCCLESSISTPYALVLIWTIQDRTPKVKTWWCCMIGFRFGSFCMSSSMEDFVCNTKSL
jgi:hypothetical protein